jgi:hypothetical protein
MWAAITQFLLVYATQAAVVGKEEKFEHKSFAKCSKSQKRLKL